MVRDSISVLHAIDGFDLGGAERMVLNLTRSLTRTRVRPVICVTRAGAARHLAVPDVPLEVLTRRSTWDPRGFVGLKRLVDRYRIDLIHAHGYSTATFVAAVKHIARVHQPLVVHGHSSDLPSWKMVLAASEVDHFIGVSEQVMEWAEQRLGLCGARATLFENALDLEQYPGRRRDEWTALFDPPPRFLGVAIANVRPVKDIHTLLNAVARSRHRDSMALIIAGSLEEAAYVESCRLLARRLGLERRIAFVGRVKAIPDLLASADFGALTSARETGPLAVLEYMAAGLPFVATNVGQVAKVCAATGLPGLVPVGDAQAAASALDEMLSIGSAERSARGERGRALIRNRFDVRERARRLEALYERILCDRPGERLESH